MDNNNVQEVQNEVESTTEDVSIETSQNFLKLVQNQTKEIHPYDNLMGLLQLYEEFHHHYSWFNNIKSTLNLVRHLEKEVPTDFAEKQKEEKKDFKPKNRGKLKKKKRVIKEYKTTQHKDKLFLAFETQRVFSVIQKFEDLFQEVEKEIINPLQALNSIAIDKSKIRNLRKSEDKENNIPEIKELEIKIKKTEVPPTNFNLDFVDRTMKRINKYYSKMGDIKEAVILKDQLNIRTTLQKLIERKQKLQEMLQKQQTNINQGINLPPGVPTPPFIENEDVASDSDVINEVS